MNSEVSVEILELILQSDILVKCIMLLLIFASMWCWAIVFDKLFKFRSLKLKTNQFNKLFWSGQTLEEIHSKVKRNPGHPMAQIFIAAMTEWETSDIGSIMNDSSKKLGLKERISNLMEVSINKSSIKLKYGINFLYITGSTSTLFGLFGTVWGIMNSFRSISSMKDTSLAVIAPGITSALITTVIGLFAAIPAIIYYNVYTAKIIAFEEEMDNFAMDMLNILSRDLDR